MRKRSIYDEDAWARNKVFSAYPGQEITKSIWEHMLNCMPPKTLPEAAADDAKLLLGFSVFGGFMMGEPYGLTKGAFHDTYPAFTNHGNRYYFLGMYAENGERQYGPLRVVSRKDWDKIPDSYKEEHSIDHPDLKCAFETYINPEAARGTTLCFENYHFVVR